MTYPYKILVGNPQGEGEEPQEIPMLRLENNTKVDIKSSKL
jgi:hypothetical protein